MSYSNINRVVLVGRLTSDPELRALSSGASVCALRIACNTTRKNAEGEYSEKPNFFAVSVFGPAGESVYRYMSRGRRVAIDGRLDWREWETPEGAKRQAVEIVAESIQFLLKRGPKRLTETDADRLAESLGDLPLALEQAGAVLYESLMTVDEYLRLLNERVADILAQGVALEYPSSMTAAWQMAFGQVRPTVLRILAVVAAATGVWLLSGGTRISGDDRVGIVFALNALGYKVSQFTIHWVPAGTTSSATG